MESIYKSSSDIVMGTFNSEIISSPYPVVSKNSYNLELTEEPEWPQEVADLMRTICQKISNPEEYNDDSTGLLWDGGITVQLVSKISNLKYRAFLRPHKNKKQTKIKLYTSQGKETIIIHTPISYFINLVPKEHSIFRLNNCVLEKTLSLVSGIFHKNELGDIFLKSDIEIKNIYTDHSDFLPKTVLSFSYHNKEDNLVHHCTLVKNKFSNVIYDYTLNKYAKLKTDYMPLLTHFGACKLISKEFNKEILPYHEVSLDYLKEKILSIMSSRPDKEWSHHDGYYQYSRQLNSLRNFIYIRAYRRKCAIYIDSSSFKYSKQNSLYKRLNNYFTDKPTTRQRMQEFI